MCRRIEKVVTYKQALVSTDAEFINRVRASFKGKVTTSVTTLKTILMRICVVGSPFDHEDIDQ